MPQGFVNHSSLFPKDLFTALRAKVGDMEQFRDMRRVTDFRVTIVAGEEEFTANIRDVARNGVRVEGLPALDEEFHVTLLVSSHRLGGTIQWQNANFTGIRLNQALPQNVESLIRHAARVPRKNGQKKRFLMH